VNRPSSPDRASTTSPQRTDGGLHADLSVISDLADLADLADPADPADLARRLPADVDVVELATEPGRPEEPRVRRLARGHLVGAVALTGCSASPEDVRERVAESRAQVLGTSRDVLGELLPIGTLKEPTTGEWLGCDDFGGSVQYHVTGRLDPAPDVTDPLADRVVDVLASIGLRLRPVRPDEDDPVTLAAVRDEVDVGFYGYTIIPFVVFDISGRCIDVGDLDREFLDEHPEHLTIG